MWAKPTAIHNRLRYGLEVQILRGVQQCQSHFSVPCYQTTTCLQVSPRGCLNTISALITAPDSCSLNHTQCQCHSYSKAESTDLYSSSNCRLRSVMNHQVGQMWCIWNPLKFESSVPQSFPQSLIFNSIVSESIEQKLKQSVF